MATPTVSSPLASFDDAALARATSRAFIEAAKSWSEYRAEPKGSPVKQLLLTSAMAAEEWWRDLMDEAEGRINEAADEELVEQVAASRVRKAVR